MVKLTLWMLLLAVIGYCCFCVFLYMRQRSLLFFPHPPTRVAGGDVFWLENDSERIKVWKAGPTGEKALIYFGGNAEDVSVNLAVFTELFPGYSLYLMNYRGYGGSSGSPTEASLYSDSLALFDEVRTHHEEIVVMGRSLGTGVATYCGAHRPVSRMVLVTPYSSIAELAAGYYPFMPVEPLIKDRFDSTRWAATITVPVLALTAENDELIPQAISDALVDSFRPGIAEHIVIERSGHNTIDQSPAYAQHLRRFLRAAHAHQQEEP